MIAFSAPGLQQMGVDLVGQDDGVVAVHQRDKVGKLLFGPDAAYRIVRRAQDEHLHALLEPLLQIFKVHHIFAGLVLFQMVVVQLAAGLFRRHVERAVDRRLDGDLVARLGQREHRHI